MAELTDKRNLRRYEVQLWTLQDSFITVLKYFNKEQKGQLQSPSMVLRDDGTQELSFSIPMYYDSKGVRTLNPLWSTIQKAPLMANMHKLKVIFNKNFTGESIFEFLITSVTENHASDNIMIEVHAEGLAFHELGKIGYKISLNIDDYLNEYNEWFNTHSASAIESGTGKPINDIHYWNKKIFGEQSTDKWSTDNYTNWTYEVKMNWSSYNNSTLSRKSNQVYEDEYVSSWNQSASGGAITPRAVENTQIKCRNIEVSDSNIYNITQTIAETFGVFCRYEYEHDYDYHITARKVIYYNNYLSDAQGHLDLTYPYDAANIQRVTDNSEITTKMYVSAVESDATGGQVVSIMDVDANKSKEDYLLNFEYMYRIGAISQEQYKAIPVYEQNIRKINTTLKKQSDKIAVLTNKITNLESQETLLTNSVTLAEQQINDANTAQANLTNNKGYIEYNKSAGVIRSGNDTYISTSHLKGMAEETININTSMGKTGANCSITKTVRDDNQQITAIYFTGIGADVNLVYLYCTYNPKIYYQQLAETWTERKTEDQKQLSSVRTQLANCKTQLDDTSNDYKESLEQKQIIINKFNKMMGPALREGYWQPEDDYKDYGDKFEARFDLSNNRDSGEIDKNVDFIWDRYKTYENEKELTYEANISGQNITTDIVIKLRDADLTAIQNHLDTLMFNYYDVMAAIGYNELLSEKPTLAQFKKTALHSLKLGAECELGWIKGSSASDSGIFPALILTGVRGLSDTERTYLSTGLIKYNSNQTVLTNYVPYISYDGGTLITWGGSDTTYKDQIIFQTGSNSNITYVRVYPRLHFKTLRLKDYSTELYMKLNNTNLENNTDYYVVEDDRTAETGGFAAGYFLTFRSETLFKYPPASRKINLVYSLSNADTNIYLDALKVSYENAFPKVSYNVQLNILNPNFISTAYNKLNRIVSINDVDLKLEEVRGYISAVTLQLDRPWEDEVEIKNYETKFEDLFTTIIAQTEAMKKSGNAIQGVLSTFSSYGVLDPTAVSNSIRQANLAYQFNQGKLTISEKDGIWALSDMGVVAMRGGGIFTATEKDADGNWIWNTGIIPSGINASLITSGQIDTNLIRIFSGEDLRFQWNGDGLYAFKSFLPNTAVEADTDRKQYVLYNADGLFLRAEVGARYPIANDQFGTVNKQVDRVEISWQGLTLRNWKGDDTFYADATTGDLTLKGDIEASGGNIAGWDINEKTLTSKDGNIIINSGNNSTSSGSITVSSSGSAYVEINNNGLKLGDSSSKLQLSNESGLIIYKQNVAKELITINTDGFKLYGSEDSVLVNLDDSGVLTLGGWEITGDTIIGNKQIYLVSGAKANKSAKIYLANKPLATTVVTQEGEVLYQYKNNTNTSDTEKYYLTETPFDLNGDNTIIENVTKVYKPVVEIVSVQPKYLYQVINTDQYTNTEQGLSNGVSMSSSVINNSSTAYIIKTSNRTNPQYVTYTENGNTIKLQYTSGDNSPSAAWYIKVQEIDPDNYTNYISEIKETVYREVTLSSSVNLISDTNADATFSVQANDGTVLIKKGTIGNFSLSKDRLSGGTLSKSRIEQNNVIIPKGGSNTKDVLFGDLFYDVEIDDTNNGVFSLKRINGKRVNFNIAALQAYKNAIAAASQITMTLTSVEDAETGDMTVTAVAVSGGGMTVTRNLQFDAEDSVVSGLYSSSGNSGCSDNCTSSCAVKCGDGCAGDCGVSCQKTCAKNCRRQCGGECSFGCGGQCEEGCTNSCNGCEGTCSGSCDETCINVGCEGHCTGQCTGGCGGSSCTGQCKGTCQGSVSSNPDCFSPSTLITLYDGITIPIRHIQKGMMVKTYNEATGTFKTARVLSVQTHKGPLNMVKVPLSNGGELDMTVSHPLLTTEGWKAFDVPRALKLHSNIDIEEINGGNYLITDSDEQIYTMDIKEYVSTEEDVVYNIDIDTYDTYLANGIVAHNKEAE